jgi:hypothetical protein
VAGADIGALHWQVRFIAPVALTLPTQGYAPVQSMQVLEGFSSTKWRVPCTLHPPFPSSVRVNELVWLVSRLMGLPPPQGELI